jgi:hypothetical protein
MQPQQSSFQENMGLLYDVVPKNATSTPSIFHFHRHFVEMNKSFTENACVLFIFTS